MKAANPEGIERTRKPAKLLDIALSVLLVGLICVPLPVTNALAEESDGTGIEESESMKAAATAAEANETSEPDDPVGAGTTMANGGATDENEGAPAPTAANELSNDAIAAAPAEISTEAPAGTATANANSDPSSVTASTADELSAALADEGVHSIELSSDIALDSTLDVAAGRDVTIIGGGHAITLDGAGAFEIEGMLSLDGTLTIKEAPTRQAGSMIAVMGGTLNMGDGVTLEGNMMAAPSGGAVSMSDGATFNMTGGVIESFSAVHGGGVYISDSRPKAISTFTMSGNAVIRGNLSTNVGGGVWVGTRSVFTMEGNAAVIGNTGDAAGGVMNYGQSTLTTVYNNNADYKAGSGAADIFNFSGAMLKLSPANPDWVLTSTGTHVTGWYEDAYGTQSDEHHRWDPTLDSNNEYIPTGTFTREELHLVAGAPLMTVIWENEDGDVLYEMDKVKAADVPAADEYATLSGNEEPTEPDTADGYVHEFTGWDESHPTDDEVLYIASYRLVAPHTLTVHYVDESGSQVAPDHRERIVEGEAYDVVSPHVDGYEADADEVTGTAGDGDVEKTVTYHKTADGAGEPEMTPEEAVAHYGAPGDNARGVEQGEHGILQQTGDGMGTMAIVLGAVSMAALMALVTALVMRKRGER